MALDQDISQLARIPMLGVLEEGALRLLAFSCESRLLRAGDALFREGERASCGYYVVTGSFLMNSAVPGTAPLVVGEGVLLGETALLRETVRPATCLAERPSSVLRISRSLFTRVLREHPDSARRVQAFLARRLAERLAIDEP